MNSELPASNRISIEFLERNNRKRDDVRSERKNDKQTKKRDDALNLSAGRFSSCHSVNSKVGIINCSDAVR